MSGHNQGITVHGPPVPTSGTEGELPATCLQTRPRPDSTRGRGTRPAPCGMEMRAMALCALVLTLAIGASATHSLHFVGLRHPGESAISDSRSMADMAAIARAQEPGVVSLPAGKQLERAAEDVICSLFGALRQPAPLNLTAVVAVLAGILAVQWRVPGGLPRWSPPPPLAANRRRSLFRVYLT